MTQHNLFPTSEAGELRLDQTAFDGQDLIERIGDDPELLHELGAIFRRDSAKEFAQLAHALEGRDGKSAAGRAHAIKGMCQNLCAPRAAEGARLLEELARGNQVSMATELLPELESALVAANDAYDAFLKFAAPR